MNDKCPNALGFLSACRDEAWYVDRELMIAAHHQHPLRWCNQCPGQYSLHRHFGFQVHELQYQA